MAEILCPTCGKSNTDDHSFCDYCGGPIKAPEGNESYSSSLGEDFFPAGESQDKESGEEMSRLDSLLSNQTESEQSSVFNEPSQAEPMDDAFRLDEILPPEKQDSQSEKIEPEDETFRLDEILPPEEKEVQPPKSEPIDDASRLDEILPPEKPDSQPEKIEPEDEAFRLDEILPPEEKEVQPYKSEPMDETLRLDEIPSSEEQETQIEGDEPISLDPGLDDPFELEDFLSTKEPAQPPRQDNDSYSPETNDDEFLLDDLFTPENSAEVTEPEITSQQDFEIPIEEEPSSDPLMEQVNQPEEQLPDITQQDDSAEPVEESGETESPYAFLDPPQPTEDPSQQEATEEGAQAAEGRDEVDPTFDTTGFEEDSGWLDMLQDPESREELEPEIDPVLKDKKPQTDWLTKIKRLNKSADMVEEDSSFPDWLTVSEEPVEEPPEIIEDEIEEPEEEASNKLPDWLQLDENDASLNEFLRKKDLTDDEYKPKFVTDNLPDDIPLPESYGAPEPEEDSSQPRKFPSWAEGEKEKEEIPEDLQFLAGMDQEGGPGKIVDPFQGEDEYLDDLFSDELPEWLTTASTIEEILPFEEEISVGDLPGWVEAMRPVVESSDASGLSGDEDYIENYGPLAGIPSVLPAEADIVQDPAKESNKPIDLIANKAQQDYVNLLKKLIGEESKTKPIQKAAPVQTQRVLRWLIAIILLVTTAATIIFGENFENPNPSNVVSSSVGYGSLHEEIEVLSEGQPVLIAHDYQPASAGELHTAAAGVVDHLMERGTYLTFMSTVPTGPVLAEHFLANTQGEHNYQHTQQYINLGYLPGESAGLLSFIIAPKKIIPLAFDGSNAWGSPPLIEVDSIQDFAMILVITDDPNTAKNWIEQVGSILEDTPLTMVVSAQVEPLIQPYFRSSPQLLSGYVSGLIDSMNYEHLIDRPNLANERWLPFNIGIIISVGTIFIGGLANGVLSLFSRHRARKIGEIK